MGDRGGPTSITGAAPHPDSFRLHRSPLQRSWHTIVLEPPSADPNASPADRQALTELLAKGMLRAVIFATEDCDATFEHIRASGAEVIQEPMDMPYGVRDCAFRDPSGNNFRLTEPRDLV